MSVVNRHDCVAWFNTAKQGNHNGVIHEEDEVPTVQMRAGALNRVRKIVKARSDEEFAAKLGVSRETLRLVESGKRCPSSVFMAGVVLATRKDFATWFEAAA